jgi:DNA-binding CsgD family transcriptional regulator
LSGLFPYKAFYGHVLEILNRGSDEIASNFIGNKGGCINSLLNSEVHPAEKRGALLMHNMDSYDLVSIAQEVDKICHGFLRARKFSYFQFKRIYRDDSFIILANHPKFFTDFLEKDFTEISQHISFHTRQSFVYSWDESLPPAILSLTRENKGIFHGITIISRRKNFYDCTTFAMSKRHPVPFSYYFHVLKELQKFAEFFPTRARSLIEKASEKPIKVLEPRQGLKRKSFFLPKRSTRFRIGDDAKDYITTYEALCVQLLQEGKSYKEIGSILSMGPGTVETHLTRLKARTGLTLQELSLQSFQKYGNKKSMFNLGN